MQPWQTALMLYVIVINLIAFAMCLYDKRAAIRKRRRVPERTLFVISFFGGAICFYLAMQLVRHKTQKWYFTLLIPFFMVVHIALFVYFLM